MLTGINTLLEWETVEEFMVPGIMFPLENCLLYTTDVVSPELQIGWTSHIHPFLLHYKRIRVSPTSQEAPNLLSNWDIWETRNDFQDPPQCEVGIVINDPAH